MNYIRCARGRLRRAVGCIRAVIALVVAWFVTTQAVAAEPPREWTPELMLQVKRVGSVQVSPDGRRVAFTVREAALADDRSEYVTQIHLSSTDGGLSRQLTQGQKSCD